MLVGGVTIDVDGKQDRSLRDKRIKAILPISPQGPGQLGLTERSWKALALPMMTVTGSKDTPQESLVETCVREVAEETGIAIGTALVPASALRDCELVNVYEIYPRWRHRYAPGTTHNTEHVFALEVPAGTAVTLAPREHLAHAWLPWREAADRCFSPSNAEAILHLPKWCPHGR